MKENNEANNSRSNLFPYQTKVEAYLIEECEAMLKYALGKGEKVPYAMVNSFQNYIFKRSNCTGTDTNLSDCPDITELVRIHDQLSKILEPARPRTIYLLEKDSEIPSFWKFLGPIPFVRKLMLVGICSMLLFIIISLSPIVNAQYGIAAANLNDGWITLVREMFLLTTASLGVTFSSLFKVSRFINAGTFDSNYESTYWVQYMLGLMAGFLLAALIPIESSVKSDLGKPLLALLGGFSADLVYRIIIRFVEAVKSMVSGDVHSMVESHRESLKAKLNEEMANNRFKLASEIMKMHQQIEDSTAPGEIKENLNRLINQLFDNNMGDAKNLPTPQSAKEDNNENNPEPLSN